MGKWYFVRYLTSEYYFDGGRMDSFAEVIFINSGESIAKYLRKKCKDNSHYRTDGYRGMPEGSSCLIEELSLLLPDGTKITGFKPHSLRNLFVDSEPQT